jgi:putative membrane protein
MTADAPRSIDPDDGEEPDPRWSLANERTMLAYERTAIGLVVAGVAIAGSHTVTDAPAWLAAIGLPLIVLGAFVALEGRHRYDSAQRAMRLREPLPPPRATAVLPWGLAAVAAGAFVLAVFNLLTS